MESSQQSLIPFQGITPELGREVLIAAGARVIGDVKLGDEASVWFNTVIRGDVHHIRIGARSNIQDNTVVHVTHQVAPTLIGDDVTIGHGALVHACTIGNRVLIGMGAIVLDQAVIPDECVVAAGALIPPGKTYPSGSLLVGSPAKVARELSEVERADLLRSANHYVKLSKSYLHLDT